MKWRNHRLTSGAIVFALTGHLLPAICAASGSIFPDAIEGRSYSSPSWQKHHRRESHYLPAYLIFCLLLWLLSPRQNAVWNFSFQSIPALLNLRALFPLIIYISFWFFIGSILHILEDALCGKVPIYSIHHRIGIRLFYVGTKKEYITTYLLVGAFLLLRAIVSFCMPVSFFQGI